MLTEPEPEGKSRDFGRKIIRITWIGVALAAVYAVSVLLYRWNQNREYQTRQKAHAAAAQRSADEESLETMGGAQFGILNFYAMPGEIHRGESVEMCYGVSNAQSVKIEPDTKRAMWPSLNRCIDITPGKTTTYTLTTTDAHGKTKTASLTIKVR